MEMSIKFTVFLILVGHVIAKRAPLQSLLDKIRDDTDLSQFYDLIEQNAIAISALEQRPLTIFAPTNAAFQKYHGNKTHVLYHMCTVALTLDNLGPQITTDFDGNPPVFVTRRRKDDQESIWVNNALIIKSRSDVKIHNANNKRQILHVIDDVLTPLTVNQATQLDFYNFDAFQFLTNSEALEIGGYRTRTYRQKVMAHNKGSILQADGGHTFFIPIDEGFKYHLRPDLIDNKVIDGHVIPGKVIFTASAPIEEPLETAAFHDNLKITASFFDVGEGRAIKHYVKSNTLISSSQYTTGTVMAEIVRANIPVRNGVVHLINRPLIVVDTTLKEFLNDEGLLSRFHDIIADNSDISDGSFMDRINRMSQDPTQRYTLFAPSNEAWASPNIRHILGNKTKMREILNLHIVYGKLDTDQIKRDNMNGITHVPTFADKKNLIFNVLQYKNGSQRFTVEGGGVNATIIQPNIATQNGYVHIIDHVLGVPFTTVYEKLRTDPMLNTTFFLGERTEFNEQLARRDMRFTYFVASNKAWRDTDLLYPSAFKKMFMSDYKNHALNILERHLVIADEAFTMTRLWELAGYSDNQELSLSTMRDQLKIRIFSENKRFSIMWNNQRIGVIRPDVECTNGIIHVLEHPLLVESDIRIALSGVGRLQQFLIGNIAMVLIVQLLL